MVNNLEMLHDELVNAVAWFQRQGECWVHLDGRQRTPLSQGDWGMPGCLGDAFETGFCGLSLRRIVFFSFFFSGEILYA